MTDDLRAQIRAQNDRFRQLDPAVPGRILFTQGVQALIAENDGASAEALMAEIARFDDFTTDNDPHGEHDFGSLTYCAERLFWKIDLYDQAFRYGSEEPGNPAKTRRVLTVMLPSEY